MYCLCETAQARQVHTVQNNSSAVLSESTCSCAHRVWVLWNSSYALVGEATEAYSSLFVSVFVRWQISATACWKLSADSCNASRTRHFKTIKFVRFSIYGFVFELCPDLLTLSWRPLWYPPKKNLLYTAFHSCVVSNQHCRHTQLLITTCSQHLFGFWLLAWCGRLLIEFSAMVADRVTATASASAAATFSWSVWRWCFAARWYRCRLRHRHTAAASAANTNLRARLKT